MIQVVEIKTGFNYTLAARALTESNCPDEKKLKNIAEALFVEPSELRRAIDLLNSGNEVAIIPQSSDGPIGTQEERKWAGLLRPAAIKIFMNFISKEFPFLVETFTCRIPNPSRDLQKLADDLTIVINNDACRLKTAVFKQEDIKSELDRFYKDGLKAVLLLRSNQISGSPLIIGSLNIEKSRVLQQVEQPTEYVEEGPNRPENWRQFRAWAGYLWYWYGGF